MTKAFSLHMKDNSSFSIKQVEQRAILHYFRIQTNSNKFYIIEFQLGAGEYSYRIYTKYGRVGSPPRKHARCFLTRLEARHEFDKILSAKRKKGYELIFVEEDWDEWTLLPLETMLQDKTNSPSLSFHTQLGKLSEIQLHKGIQILTEIEEKILKGTHDVMDLTNQFYSVIPVVFENPIDKSYLLDTLEKVQAKKEWLTDRNLG
jgi:predicted DNA-binding WGR domain protein